MGTVENQSHLTVEIQNAQPAIPKNIQNAS